jgi:hypothetical protein
MHISKGAYLASLAARNILSARGPPSGGDNYWDYAPDYSNDVHKPYPDLPDKDTVTIENVRGTHIYGFQGCEDPEVGAIKQAYKDMNRLASQDGVKSNIDWNGKAATDFFGPGDGKQHTIPTDTRSEIQREYSSFSTNPQLLASNLN